MRRWPVLLAALLLLTLPALAGGVRDTAAGPGAGEPPAGWPDWVVWLLAAALPFVFQFLLGRLPGPVKVVICYALGAAVGIAIGFLVHGWTSWLDILRNTAWLWSGMTFVYGLIVKPAVKRLRVKAKLQPLGLIAAKFAKAD
ncbi:hypothetical protein FJY71_03930 [candidate division WOR-3 bacterium]|nr:hypothetical protein [candidate division WOR-3 bacterium]